MNDFNSSQNKSTPDYIRHFLKNPPLLLQNFHYEDKMEFLKLGSIQNYGKDDVVIEENNQVDSAYLVIRGKVGIWKESIQLTSLGEGEFIGEAFLFSQQPHGKGDF
jgi:CRP-like cAMP-binding protein